MSDIVRVTRHEEFELAHVLTGYNGDCGRLHGHEYRVEVTLEGPQTDPFGMVVDFKDLKRVMKAVIPDHYFVYFDEDETGKDIATTLRRHGILSKSLPFVTTAENMAPYFGKEIEKMLHDEGYTEVEVVEVKLWETSNSYATYIKNRRKCGEDE